jgi:tetratricopeptide (TPR) repeat protein
LLVESYDLRSRCKIGHVTCRLACPVLVIATLAAAGLAPPSIRAQAPARPIGRPGASFGCTQPRPAPRPARRADPGIAQLLSAYETEGAGILGRKIATSKAFDDLRQNMPAEIERWKLDRRRIHAMFLLDLADLGFQRNWYYWLDVLDLARRFVTSRPDSPGVNSADDAFELAWHKTAAGLVALARRPDMFEDCVVQALSGRIAPAAQPNAEKPLLIDPWFALIKGFAEESWTISDHALLATRGSRAMALFDEAAAFAPVRGEALVRKARLEIRAGDYDAAVRTLEVAGDPAADAAVRYWARLLRGRALEGAGRLDDAARAYRDTLAFMPQTQSPTVALMALAYTRDRSADALDYRDAIRSGETGAPDPWWQYDYGDGRFYLGRLAALREASRQ